MPARVCFLFLWVVLAAAGRAETPATLPNGAPPAAAAAAPTAATDGPQPVAGADEFGSLESTAEPAQHDHAQFRGEAKAFRWVLGILFATVVAGLLVRFSLTRNLRAVFLTASIAVLGFYKGACPCPIQSLQYTWLNVLGHDYKWQTLVYLLGLIPVTYLFGRVFCGWICHLGAVQEMMFLGSRFRLLQSERAQRVMRWLRIAALVGLGLQIAVTRTNLFKKIDPFAVLYNFSAVDATGWVLVGVLVVASVLLHRPFCKTLCPVGLVLGWVAKVPGASVLGPSAQCAGCSTCRAACRINAITRDGKRSVLDNQECIRCGECLSSCRKSSLTFHRRGERHPVRVEISSPPEMATRSVVPEPRAATGFAPRLAAALPRSALSASVQGGIRFDPTNPGS